MEELVALGGVRRLLSELRNVGCLHADDSSVVHHGRSTNKIGLCIVQTRSISCVEPDVDAANLELPVHGTDAARYPDVHGSRFTHPRFAATNPLDQTVDLDCGTCIEALVD